MLNLMLVLGQVPGTNFQLTFNEIRSALMVLVEIILLLHYRSRIWRFIRTARFNLTTPKGTQLKLQV